MLASFVDLMIAAFVLFLAECPCHLDVTMPGDIYETMLQDLMKKGVGKEASKNARVRQTQFQKDEAQRMAVKLRADKIAGKMAKVREMLEATDGKPPWLANASAEAARLRAHSNLHAFAQ